MNGAVERGIGVNSVGFLLKRWAHLKARQLPLDKPHKAELLPIVSQSYKAFILCTYHGEPFDLFNLAAAQTMHISGVA